MEFILNINLDNDAFQPAPTQELVRMLKDITEGIEEGIDFCYFDTIMDINGNKVGSIDIKE